ncbi:MAG: VanZ family protein [Myxococcota bacterium]
MNGFVAWAMWAPVAIYAAAIFYMSSQPAPEAVAGSDFELHVLAYALMGALIVRATWFSTRWSESRVFLTGALGAWLYGMSDELHQAFVPSRSATWSDVAADGLGAFLGAGLAMAGYLLVRRVARQRAAGDPRRLPFGRNP